MQLPASHRCISAIRGSRHGSLIEFNNTKSLFCQSILLFLAFYCSSAVSSLEWAMQYVCCCSVYREYNLWQIFAGGKIQRQMHKAHDVLDVVTLHKQAANSNDQMVYVQFAVYAQHIKGVYGSLSWMVTYMLQKCVLPMVCWCLNISNMFHR